MSTTRWYGVLNDLVGGWAVGNRDAPMSAYGAPGDYVLADLMTEGDARAIAALLNLHGYAPTREAEGPGRGGKYPPPGPDLPLEGATDAPSCSGAHPDAGPYWGNSTVREEPE